MTLLASTLMALSAGIMLVLGVLHLVFTFHGPRLLPREPALQQRMQAVSPVITRQTTMWKAWVGFNASHSHGLILFGTLYAYLALAQAPLLFGSPFLLVLGLLVLLGYAVLARTYFFNAPLRGVLLATAAYGLSLVLAWLA